MGEMGRQQGRWHCSRSNSEEAGTGNRPREHTKDRAGVQGNLRSVLPAKGGRGHYGWTEIEEGGSQDGSFFGGFVRGSGIRKYKGTGRSVLFNLPVAGGCNFSKNQR
jgi:hypothetical protein